MSIYKEKDPSFIQETRIEGNLSVVEHPNNNSQYFYGDGSVEVSGTLSADVFKSATPDSNISVSSPFNFKHLANRPNLPLSTSTQLFADASLNGRLVMVDSTGQIIDVNPLRNIGDLMTFDAVKNTTVKLPVGLPQQSLQIDPDMSLATRLAWKTDYANVFSVNEPSDGYLRYVEACNSSPFSLTNSPQEILTDVIYRVDTDSFSIASGGAGGIAILQPGTYEIIYKTRVSFDKELVSETVISDNNVICVQTYIYAGSVIIPASNSWRNLSYSSTSLVSSATTITTKMTLNFSSSTTVRFFALETGSNFGVLQIDSTATNVSITKLAWKDYVGTCAATNGLQGSRPQLSSNYVTIPLKNVIYKNDSNDNLDGNGNLVIASAGLHNLTARFAFEKESVNTDLQAVIKCHLLINGVEVQNGVARTTLKGPVGNESVSINTIASISAGDSISIACLIESGNLTSGGITAVSEECSVTTFTPYLPQWKRISYHGSSIYNPVSSHYLSVNLDLQDYIDGDYYKCQSDGVITVISGGTYTYSFNADVCNNDGEVYSAIIRLVADTGCGWKEVPGSTQFITLSPGEIHTQYCSGTMYLLPQTLLKIEVFSPDSGSIVLTSESVFLSIGKLENTRTSFTGTAEFGNFYDYVNDDNLVITTSTDFSMRLMAITIDLPAGYYRFGISFEWDMNTAGVGFNTQVILDNSTVIDTINKIPITTGIYTKETTFNKIYLDAGEHTVAFQTRVLDATRSLSTRNVRIEFWKL